MRTVNLTEFRSHASGILTEVEHGETLIVLRHGRPIAQVSPIENEKNRRPSWKMPAIRLTAKGEALSTAVLEEREYENLP